MRTAKAEFVSSSAPLEKRVWRKDYAVGSAVIRPVALVAGVRVGGSHGDPRAEDITGDDACTASSA